MKGLFACLAAFLLAAPSEPVATGPGTQHFAGMPPERFWREDVAIVIFLNDVTELCGHAPEGLTMIACTRRIEGQVVVVMPHPAPYGSAGDYYGGILAHELAHVAGWPGDHPE